MPIFFFGWGKVFPNCTFMNNWLFFVLFLNNGIFAEICGCSLIHVITYQRFSILIMCFVIMLTVCCVVVLCPENKGKNGRMWCASTKTRY
jgi:uncharacterized membrane protein